jgi:peptidoglycan/LPS O-acetylase OafA/YrhL
MISGFVIAVSVDRYSRRGFLVGRGMRVLPTYAAGYLVSCTVIWAMSDPADELNVRSVLIGCVPGLGILLGVPTPGDGIVWTLVVEMVFYGVCLIGFRRLTRGWVPTVLIAAGCVLVAALLRHGVVPGAFAGVTFILLIAVPFIPVMLVGVVLSGDRRGQVSRRTTLVLGPALVAVHVVLLAVNPILGSSLEYHLGCLLAIALFGLAWLAGDRWRRFRPADALAEISYPLYVVHPVLGYALIAVLVAHGARPIVAVLAATVAALLAAWALHVAVEIPTHRWGRRWARSLSPAPVATAAPVPDRVEPAPTR